MLTYTNFYSIGLSYKKADAHLRGCFSLDKEKKNKLLKDALENNVDTLLVISTCNRTELYGFAEHPFQLIKLLCTHAGQAVEVFEKVGYVYKNREAISHLFRVGTGLDSQILGDFEIISQLKQSVAQSKRLKAVNPFLERLCNAVIQASKRIKHETEISSGATSVAFASVQYILNHVEQISEKRILLFGTGKIGRNTCENLIKHTQNPHITLINRTENTAKKVAGKFNLTVKPHNALPMELHKADIVIVATGAQAPTLSEAMIPKDRKLLILDLSIPKNVEERVAHLPLVTLVHLDALSRITDATLEKRKQHIPQAEAIIETVKSDFIKWVEDRKFAPTIHALKKKLKTLNDAEIDFQRKKNASFDAQQAEMLSNRMIQKITTHFANHLKDGRNNSDESIMLIQKMFQLDNEF